MGPASGSKNIAEVYMTIYPSLFQIWQNRLTISIGSCISLMAGLGREPGIGYSTCFSPFIRKTEKRYPLATAEFLREGS